MRRKRLVQRGKVTPRKLLVHRAIVLHFMLQLSLVDDADSLLKRQRMGRIHHRILYFAHFSPGITPNELLSVLNVRHQNIQAALRQLLDGGLLIARPDTADARIKRLHSSPIGDKLLGIVSARQRARIARGYHTVTPQEVKSYLKVAASMLDPERRAWVDRLSGLSD